MDVHVHIEEPNVRETPVVSSEARNKRFSFYYVRAAVSATKNLFRRVWLHDPREPTHLDIIIFYSIVVSIMLCLAIAAALGFSAVVRSTLPEWPRFLLESASFTVHNTTSSSSYLTATFLFSLRVINPNAHAAASYDQIHTALFKSGFAKTSIFRDYRMELPLDVALMPPFHQERLAQSIIPLRFNMVNEYVGEKVKKDMTTGFVNLGLMVETVIDLEKDFMGASRSRFKCDKLRFGNSSHDDDDEGSWSMISPSKECKLDLN